MNSPTHQLTNSRIRQVILLVDQRGDAIGRLAVERKDVLTYFWARRIDVDRRAGAELRVELPMQFGRRRDERHAREPIDGEETPLFEVGHDHRSPQQD